MDEQLDPLTRRIIGCAIEVHRFLGRGLLESIYRTGLAVELKHGGLTFDRERRVGVDYRGVTLGNSTPISSSKSRSSSK